MTKPDYSKIAREALTEVNKIRKILGRKPLVKLPRGIPNDPEACPIAKAICANIDARDMQLLSKKYSDRGRLYKKLIAAGYSYKRVGIDFKTPEALCMFIIVFDKGKYPEMALD